VPGGQCCLVLGDRPIEITLSRAWEALSWPRRLQLLGDFASAGMAGSGKVSPCNLARATTLGVFVLIGVCLCCMLSPSCALSPGCA
jgi:pheromone shutdown protein TraB